MLAYCATAPSTKEVGNPVERIDPVVAGDERWRGEPILSPTRISTAPLRDMGDDLHVAHSKSRSESRSWR